MPPKKKSTEKKMKEAKREHNRKYGDKNYELEHHKKLTDTPDGRKLYLSYQRAGDGLVLTESESEEELPPPPPQAPPRAVFASILKEAKSDTQHGGPNSRTHYHGNVLNGNRFQRGPKSQPTRTEADRIREASIQKARDGYLRTTVPICKTQHKVLVCQWSFFDPINLKGTWHLEALDFRRTYFSNGGEEHEQCNVGSMPELLNQLARRMMFDWEKSAPQQIAEEPDYDKRQLLKEKLEMKGRGLPSIMKIERELGPLAVYVMGSISGEGNAGHKGNEGKKEDKEKENGKSQKLDRAVVKKQKKERGDAANLARLTKLMADKKQRKVEDDARVKRDKENRAEVQRIANSAEVFYDHINKRHVQKANTRTPAQPEMTEEDEKLSKSIRAAERRDRKRQEQAEREEEERQQSSADEIEGVRVGEREESPDDGLSAAMLDALDNACPESPKKRPTKEPKKKVKVLKHSTTKSAAEEPEPSSSPPEKRKKKLRTRVRPVLQDSSDSDSVKPPRPGKSSEPTKPKPKAKPTIRKPTVPFAKHLEAKKAAQSGGSESEELKKPDESSGKSKASSKSETKETKTPKTKEGKVHKSEEFVADNDLEDDTPEVVKLPSDKLQSEGVSVETTETTTATVHSKQGGDVVKETVETTTVVVEAQQLDGTIERTETTAVSSNSSEWGETILKHSTHTQAVTSLEVPQQDLPRDSPPPSPEQELQDGFNTPTNALGIKVTVSSPPAPPPLPTPPSSYGKRKRPTADKVSQSEQETEAKQDEAPLSPTSPSSAKKRKITPPVSPTAGNVVAPSDSSTPPATENAASAESATSSPKPATTSPPTSPRSASVASSTSSSSRKKRKMKWSEEEGEVTISPGGTKRVKRIQASGVAVSEETTAAGPVQGDGEDDAQAHTEIDVGLEEVENVRVGGEPSPESWNSLFDERATGAEVVQAEIERTAATEDWRDG